MSGENTVSTLNGLFKEVYADKIVDLVPSQVKLINMIPFSLGDKQLGNSFNEPVILGLEGGFTYGGVDGNVFALNNYISFPMQNAQVKSAELVLRSAISVGAAARSVSNKGAFEKGTKLLVGNMLKSMYHRLEIQMIYGGSEDGLGIVETATDAGVIKIEDQEWASGIWVGVKARINIYSAAGTIRNLGTDAFINSFSIENKELNITDVSGAPIALATAGVLATDVIYFEGAKGKEFLGLHALATTRGTVFGIDNTNEPLFQGNIVNVGADYANPAVLSFKVIEDAVARSVEKGLGEETITVMLNVNSWNSLLTEQSAKRRYDNSYKSAEVGEGSRVIKFYGQAGEIKIIPSTFVKEGHAFAFVDKDLARVGSTDVTFDPPGFEGEFFRVLENSNGYEMRAYSDMALFSSRLSSITLLRYIKNS